MTISEAEARGWMDAMARVVDLTIPAASRDGVAAQLVLNYRLIGPLLEFELPEGDLSMPALGS